MPIAQYVCEAQKIHVSRRMSAPKRVEQVMEWYKRARKISPEIPQLCEDHAQDINQCAFNQDPESKTHWHLANSVDITVKFIKFTLINAIGERAHLVIDRTAPSIGP